VTAKEHLLDEVLWKGGGRVDEVPSSPRTVVAGEEPEGRPPTVPPATGEPIEEAGSQPRAVGSGTESPASVRRMIQTVATVIGPATLVTALAFYFGWVSTNARFRYFGLDASVLGLTLQEVLLYATDALFLPILAIVVVALIALTVHSVLIRWADRKGPLTTRVERISIVMFVVGGILFPAGVWAALYGLPIPTPFLLQQLSVGIGIALLAYAVYIRRRARAGIRGAVPIDPEFRRLWSAGLVLVWLIIGLSVFWAASEFSEALGRGRAMRMESSLALMPSLVIYSERDLHVQGPGVVKEQLEGEDSAYRFRYSGLTFLLRSGGKYFLVPTGWIRSQGSVITLSDADTLRVEFVVKAQ
jgi:hypothetical protein